MSWTERLWNVARAEMLAVRRRLQRSEAAGTNASPPEDAEDAGEPEVPAVPSEIRRYYANLELPVGASMAQVRAAYRRLVVQYHPDRHAQNPDAAEAAHRVTLELRTAYEGLTEYLRADGRE